MSRDTTATIEQLQGAQKSSSFIFELKYSIIFKNKMLISMLIYPRAFILDVNFACHKVA